MTRLPVPSPSSAEGSGHWQRTRTSSAASTAATAGQPIRCSRSGLMTSSPSAAAVIRGRSATVYAAPVISSRPRAVTTDSRSRPCTARSIRLATANAVQTHHATTAIGERNTCLPEQSSSIPTFQGQHEPVLRELSDERVDHTGELTTGGAKHRALPVARGAGLQHLGYHGDLFRAAKPPCYRLQVAERLKDLVPQRGRRARLIGDDDRVEPVPGGAPLVVRDHPRRPARQPVAPVKLGVE